MTSFDKTFLDAAARLFTRQLARLREQIPAVPAKPTDPGRVRERIEEIMASCGGLVALARGELVGYLGWWLVDDFRGAGRKAAYVPEWAHAAGVGEPDDALTARVYRALYRAASTQWAAAGCSVHAITLLAHDHATERAWFWNGFGLLVVDAVCLTTHLPVTRPTRLSIRRATRTDAAALAALDAEHVRHYAAPPVFMAPPAAFSAALWAEFLTQPMNGAWLAAESEAPVGFIRFDGHNYDGVELLSEENIVGINGAYIRPAYRGQGSAVAMLAAALRHYAVGGITTCAVNFESFNPEAAGFWPRYFQPVCLSLMRMPENPTAAEWQLAANDGDG